MRSGRILGGVILVLACARMADAQSIGLKGGWARPSLGGSAASGWSAINTFAGGAFAGLPITRTLAVELDALYVPKGAQAEAGTHKLKATYIEVPLLARVGLPTPWRLRPALFAGPHIAFNTSCKLEATGSQGPVSGDCAELGEPIKSTDFGATFGGGAAFALPGPLWGHLEVRYDLGLTRTDDEPPARDVRNRAFMLFAGLSLPLRRGGEVEAMRAR